MGVLGVGSLIASLASKASICNGVLSVSRKAWLADLLISKQASQRNSREELAHIFCTNLR